jgi:hypothetical protein
MATHKIDAGSSASFHAHGINHHAQTEFAKFWRDSVVAPACF